MNDWIKWAGGACPVPIGTMVEVRFRDGEHLGPVPAGVSLPGITREANGNFWLNENMGGDIVAYRVVQPAAETTEPASGGGKLAGDHYYRVTVNDPISPEVKPYTAECADIIESLGMTFNEGEAFKALWRLAAARHGRGKAGNKPQYDADKVAHYGARVAAQTKRGAQ